MWGGGNGVEGGGPTTGAGHQVLHSCLLNDIFNGLKIVKGVDSRQEVVFSCGVHPPCKFVISGNHLHPVLDLYLSYACCIRKCACPETFTLVWHLPSLPLPHWPSLGPGLVKGIANSKLVLLASLAPPPPPLPSGAHGGQVVCEEALAIEVLRLFGAAAASKLSYGGGFGGGGGSGLGSGGDGSSGGTVPSGPSSSLLPPAPASPEGAAPMGEVTLALPPQQQQQVGRIVQPPPPRGGGGGPGMPPHAPSPGNSSFKSLPALREEDSIEVEGLALAAAVAATTAATAPPGTPLPSPDGARAAGREKPPVTVGAITPCAPAEGGASPPLPLTPLADAGSLELAGVSGGSSGGAAAPPPPPLPGTLPAPPFQQGAVPPSAFGSPLEPPAASLLSLPPSSAIPAISSGKASLWFSTEGDPYVTGVQAHRTGVFRFKGNNDDVHMVYLVTHMLEGRRCVGGRGEG